MLDNLYMIVAATEKSRAIGLEGDMIYTLKDDLRYFKEVTQGHTIVCGSRTFYSFPKRPLPNRKNIVLTRTQDVFEGAYVMHSKEEVLEYANAHPEEKIFILGGDNVYTQFINDASKLYVTEIEENFPPVADSFFPKFNPDDYEIESESEKIENPDGPDYRYLVYRKKEALD